MANEAESALGVGIESESQIISGIIICGTQHIADVHILSAVFSSTVRGGEEPVSLIAVEVRCAVHHCSVIGGSSVSLIMTLISSSSSRRRPDLR